MTGVEIAAGVGLAVAPDLVKAGINLLLDSDRAKTLASRTLSRENGPVPKRRLAGWLREPEAWELLGPLDADLTDEIAEWLTTKYADRPTLKMKRLKDPERSEYIGRLAHGLVINFVASLDPSYAAALSHRRNEKRFDRVDGALVALDRGMNRIDPDLLARTPPAVGRILKRSFTTDPERCGLLLQYLANQAGSTNDVARLLNEQPDWLRGCGPDLWRALAGFAAAHDDQPLAASMWERARHEGGETTSHLLLVLQALSHQERNPQEGLALLDGAVDDPDHLVAGARSMLGGDPTPAAALWNDPYELSDPSAQRVAASMRIAGHFAAKSYVLVRTLLAEMAERLEPTAWISEHDALAAAALADAEPFGSFEHQQLLKECIASARQAIEHNRPWKGPTLDPTRLALRAALGTYQPEVIVELGAAPPAGSADPSVAMHPDVVDNLLTAFLQLDRFDEAAHLGETASSQYVATTVVAAQLIEDDPTESANQFRHALSLTDDPEQQVGALAGLANLGHDPREHHDFDDTIARYQQLLIADYHLAIHEPAEALKALALVEDGVPRRQRVARCHLALDEPLIAAETLLRTGLDYRHAASTIGGADLLIDNNELHAAEGALTSALVAVPAADHDSYQIRARLMQLAIDRNDWAELEFTARLALHASPQRKEAHWALIEAHVQRGRSRRAFEQLQSRPDLDVHDEHSAVRKIELLTRYAPTLETAVAVFDLADRYQHSEAVRVAALAVTRTLDNIETLPDDITTRAQRHWQDFFDDFPDSDAIKQIPIGETVDEIIASLKPVLEPRARMLDDLAQQYRNGKIPAGLFSQLARVPYAAVCLAGGPEGFMLAVSVNDWLNDREIQHAIDAATRPLVFDTSALATAIRTNNHWIATRHGNNLIAAQTADDLRRSVEFVDNAGDGSMRWNLDTGLPVFTDTDEHQLSAQRASADRLVNLIADFDEVRLSGADWPNELDELGDDLRSEPWIAGIALALQRNAAYVSDDLVLRQLARHYGLRTFSTYATIAAAHLATTTQLRRNSEIDALAVAGHVDLPNGVDRLIRIGNADDGKARTAALIISRPATWRENPQAVLQARSELLTALADRDRINEIPRWFAASTLGYTLVLDQKDRLDAIAAQLVSAILHIGAQRAPTPELLAAARSLLRAVGLDPTRHDPLTIATKHLRDFIVESTDIDPSIVPILVEQTFLGLSDTDRSIVVAALLSP